MSIKLLLLYFIIGGTVVALVSYLGTQTKGILASFFSNSPTISVITLCIIYANSGAVAGSSYFKGLLMMVPAWVLYVLITSFLLPRIGLVPALAIGVSLYIVGGMTIMRFVR